MTPLNEAVAEWRRKQEKHVVQTKQYDKTAKEIDKLLDRIKELQAEVEEANDNATWWFNRYNAIYKQQCSRSDCAGRIKNSKKYDSIQQRWDNFKQWLIDYRFNKTGSHEDGRYCVAISVTDLLAKMDEMEENNERQEK